MSSKKTKGGATDFLEMTVDSEHGILLGSCKVRDCDWRDYVRLLSWEPAESRLYERHKSHWLEKHISPEAR